MSKHIITAGRAMLPVGCVWLQANAKFKSCRCSKEVDQGITGGVQSCSTMGRLAMAGPGVWLEAEFFFN